MSVLPIRSPSIIHIGANKTASTTLQRAVFSQCKDINYLGEDCLNYQELQPILDSLVNEDDLYYNKRETERVFNKCLVEGEGKTFIYSNEDIMTSMIPSQCAVRLKELVPNAKIMVVLRNQLTAIPSWYLNHGAFLRNVPQSYWKRFVSFDDWMNYCSMFFNKSPLVGFQYNELISLYEKHFGKNNIEIFLFEDFVKDRKNFILKLSWLTGISYETINSLLRNSHERRGITRRKFLAHQLKHKFCFSKIDSRFRLPQFIQNRFEQYLSGGEKIVYQMDPKWVNKIYDMYAEGNNRLNLRYGLTLDQYQYPLEVH